ncbi:MAG: MFS transporter [Phycisphaerae bacterium]|nr:MFS transporter [Phycisphaerae bacterium]
MASEKTDILQRLDGLHWTKLHTGVTLALGVGWLLDSFEVNLTGSVLEILKKQFDVTSQQAAWITGTWLLGIMAGAVVFGYLADQFGRKKLFIMTLALYAICTVLSSLSPDYWLFMVFRFLTAMGVGAEYSAISSAIGEFLPVKSRGRAAALVMNFWPVGAMLAALANWICLTLLAQYPSIAWRVAFALGAIGAVFVAWFRKTVPESPRWLLSRGKIREAAAVVRRFELAATPAAPERALSETSLSAAPLQRRGFGSQIRELLRDYPGRLALGSILDLSEAFGYYGLFTFMALKVLPAIHVSDTLVPAFYFIGNVAALVGGLCMVLMFDRLGRKFTVTSFYALAALCTALLIPALETQSAWMVLGAFMLANFAATGAWTSAYPTFSEIFPTHLRATGIGMSVAVGRVGAMASGPLLVWLSNQMGANAAFGLVSALWLVGCAAMIPWCLHGMDGAGLSLEQMVEVAPLTV